MKDPGPKFETEFEGKTLARTSKNEREQLVGVKDRLSGSFVRSYKTHADATRALNTFHATGNST